MSALLRAQQISGAANFQIAHGNTKARAQHAVVLYGAQTPARVVGQRTTLGQKQIAIRAVVGATHAPAQLMQVRQAMQIRQVNEHGVGARIVNSTFNDGRAH